MRYLFPLYGFVLFLTLSQQANAADVVIQIHGKDSANIYYYNKPHPFYYFDLLNLSRNIEKKIGRSSTIHFPNIRTGYFHIIIENNYSLHFILDPNDTTIVDLYFDSTNAGTVLVPSRVLFSGSNSIVTNTFYKIFSPKNFIPVQTNISAIASKSNNYYSYFISSKKYIDSIVISISERLKINYCSQDTRKLYLLELTARLYNEVIKNLGRVKTGDSTFINYRNWELTKNNIALYGEAFNRELLQTFLGKFLYERFAQQSIYDDFTISDTLLKRGDMTFFYRYDSDYQEEAWGSRFLYYKKKYPFSENTTDSINFQCFKKYHPNSHYVFEYENILDSLKKIRYSKLIYQEINLSTLLSLKEISSLYTDRFYFVDVWATWCIPCLSEFAFTTPLESHLDSLKIKKIYLSIDEITDSTKWKTFIKKYYLNGSHYIAGKEIQVDLIKKLVKSSKKGGLTIPQYFLYDKLKDKFYMNLSRPSSGTILVEEIKKIVSEGD